MHSRKIFLFFMILAVLMIMPLFAVIPNPFILDFDPRGNINSPSLTVANKVYICHEYWNGKYNKTIYFGGNGVKVSDQYGKSLISYDNIKRRYYRHEFSEWNDYKGNTFYSINDSEQIDTIISNISGMFNLSYSRKIISYKNNRIDFINTYSRSQSRLSLMSQILFSFEDTKFIYNNDGSPNQVIHEIENSLYNYRVNNPNYRTAYIYKNNLLVELIEEKNLSTSYYSVDTTRYVYNERGQLIEQLKSYIDSSGVSGYVLNSSYAYYDNGLLKEIKYNDTGNTYTYEYESYKPAKFFIEFPNAQGKIGLWTYRSNLNYNEYDLKNSHVAAETNIPCTEIHLVNILGQINYPIILSPGKTVNMFIENGSIRISKKDTLNNMILLIENQIEKVKPVTTPDGLKANISNFILNNMKTYPDLLSYVIYVDYWDMENNRQEYVDYLDRIVNKYPYSYHMMDVYTMYKKQK